MTKCRIFAFAIFEFCNFFVTKEEWYFCWIDTSYHTEYLTIYVLFHVDITSRVLEGFVVIELDSLTNYIIRNGSFLIILSTVKDAIVSLEVLGLIGTPHSSKSSWSCSFRSWSFSSLSMNRSLYFELEKVEKTLYDIIGLFFKSVQNNMFLSMTISENW